MAEAFDSCVHYFLPEATDVSVTPLGKGNINDTYMVRLQWKGLAAQYILQRFNHHIFREPEKVMENIDRICRWLSDAQQYGLQTPAPLKNAAGSMLYHDAGGNYWRMFPFVPHAYAPERVENAAVAETAARAYGRFLRTLQDFPGAGLFETIQGFHDTERRWALYESVLESDPAGRMAATAAERALMQTARPVFLEIHRLKSSGALPVRVTHNDTKAGNVLLDETSGAALAVIDLDTVMPGTVLSDFGDMVRTFVPNMYEDNPDIAGLELRMDILEALLRGFLQETEGILAPAERDHLLLGGAWIVGEQALRFLSDYLAGDTYYKIAYPEHNLVRARNQLALFSKIAALL